MSYILDALQKAAAERQRGQVPTLAPSAVMASAPSPESRRAWKPWLGGLLAGVCAILAVVWWMGHRPAVAPAVAPASAPSPATPGPMAETRSGRPSSTSDQPFQGAGPILAPAPEPAKPHNTRPAAAPQASSAQARQLTISGSTWSDNPDHRLLIVNNQVVREGQEVRPGLVLETIGQNSAIFNEGGQRFNLNY